MKPLFFIDTNVFVYQLDSADGRKQALADTLIQSAIADGKGCISTQVVQECLNVITRKAAVPLDSASAQQYLDVVLMPLVRVMPSSALFHAGLRLQQRYRLSFYDSMIVAAAQELGCKTLFSEDLQHGQTIEGLEIINPFV